MVKVDIVRAIQLETGLQFGEAEQLVNELLEIMKQTLENGEDVLITGLGKFQLRQKSSRPGRDPKNKQDYTCLLYTSPSPRDRSLSRMPSSA